MVELKELCVQCGEEAYQYRDKTYKLCAECAWEYLRLNYPEDKEKSAQEKVTEAVQYETI